MIKLQTSEGKVGYSYVAHRLIVCCNAFYGSLSRWIRNWHHYFCHIIHQISCDGGGPLYLRAHFVLPTLPVKVHDAALRPLLNIMDSASHNPVASLGSNPWVAEQQSVVPRVALIFKSIIILLIIFLGFIKSKPC